MIATLHAMNVMPIKLDLARLDDGGDIEETLRNKYTQYYQNCRIMFNSSKLVRVRTTKQKAESAAQPV